MTVYLLQLPATKTSDSISIIRQYGRVSTSILGVEWDKTLPHVTSGDQKVRREACCSWQVVCTAMTGNMEGRQTDQMCLGSQSYDLLN